jgi:hypothetical protein
LPAGIFEGDDWSGEREGQVGARLGSIGAKKSAKMDTTNSMMTTSISPIMPMLRAPEAAPYERGIAFIATARTA